MEQFEIEDFGLEGNSNEAAANGHRGMAGDGDGNGSPVDSGGHQQAGGQAGGAEAHPGNETHELGLFEGITNEDYHSGPGISSSNVKSFREAPELYRANNAGEIPRKETDAFDFGSACHKMVLEGRDFDDEFLVTPKFDKRTKAGKAGYSEYEILAAGRTMINQASYDHMNRMRDVLMRHPAIVDHELFITGKGKPELSGYYTDPTTGLLCKYRPDWRTEWCIADLKTAASASDAAFSAQSRRLGYEISAAHYIEGDSISTDTDHDQFIFAVQEKEPPYLVNVKVLGSKTLELGRHRRRQALNGINECMKTGEWPHFNSNIATILEYPNYCFNEME